MSESAVRNLDQVLAGIPEHWSPRTVAVLLLVLLVLLEPSSTSNTGDTPSGHTAPRRVV